MEQKFKMEQLDQELLVQLNTLSIVTNSSTFNAGGFTSDGLLSNNIFGTSTQDRADTFGYISLSDYFIQPYFYKIWLKIDSAIRSIVYETKTYKINSSGYFEEDPNGETGIEFLRKNIDKIKFKNTKREPLLNVLMANKKKMFTRKFIIIPAYYRDVNTSRGERVGLGELNKLYVTLMNNVKALSESSDYGLSLTGGLKGKVQDSMLEVYNWITIGEAVPGEEHTGSGIFKKYGILRRSNLSKTTDLSARLVLSASNIDHDSLDDFMVDLDHSAVPLSASCVIFYPYMLYYLRQWFSNEFGGKIKYPYTPDGKETQYLTLKNPQIEFSDERFDKEIDKFIHSFTNRFEPITIPTEEGIDIHLKFKGSSITQEEYAAGKREGDTLTERYLTWCDLFYMAACEASSDKMVLITRYPVDSYFNQITTKCNIYSTVETESVILNGKLYKWYPKIHPEDLGTNTNNKFIDTLSIANPYCGLMGADFDGDQVTVKAAYTTESNEELLAQLKSKSQLITMGGVNGRKAEKEALQAIYNLTLVLPGTKLIDPVF